jgi:hypothetical protein
MNTHLLHWHVWRCASEFAAIVLDEHFLMNMHSQKFLAFKMICSIWGIRMGLILQLIFQHQVMDRLFISPEKVQWIVMPIPAVVSLLGDLSLVLLPCPQAQAQIMCQLMMQLNIVNALIVRKWHFWSAKIVAHF